MAEWMGCMVSITSYHGNYQGIIISATNSHITLTKAFCDGVPSNAPSVIILASEITDLQLIKKADDSVINEISTVPKVKPAKQAGKAHSVGNPRAHNGSTSAASSSKPIEIQPRHSFNDYPADFGSLHTAAATPTNFSRRERNKSRYGRSWKDEACFGSPVDQSFTKDFDFEKNLALFDKQAVFEQINSQKPDLVKHSEQKKPTKYRHDENVIATKPTTLRQIIVPSDVCEYVTDDGLVIPTISCSLRKKLWITAEQVGLTWERRVELMGRAATEMAVHLLGGAHRLNPQNTHQWPTVAFLIGPTKHGSVGINAARQLASQGVNTLLYSIPAETEANQQELYLYKLTQNRSHVGVSQVPANVDLVIVALCEDGENVKMVAHVAAWISGVRAPILALDPPAAGTPGINAKFSLVPVLPLAHAPSNGKIYLCNLGFPAEIFSRVNIMYKSPFGPKFVIPLHPRVC